MRAHVTIALPLVAFLLAAEPVAERAPSPWFLPRYALVGAYAGNGVFSPTVRVGFEWALIEQKTELVLLLEGGPSWGVLRPAGVTRSYQHSAGAGIGLRSRRLAKIQWGLSVTAGPVVYGARFSDAAKNEERVNGVVDGRGQLGLNLGPLVLALYLGYQQVFDANPRFAAVPFVGGVTFGVLVNWR